MKKILALISLVAVFILAACGQTTKTDGATTQTQAAAVQIHNFYASSLESLLQEH